MAYTTKNYPTKKALVEDFKAGKDIYVYNPGLGGEIGSQRVYLEGPHYPKPHRWYAAGQTKDGKLVSIDGVKLLAPKPKTDKLTCYDLGPFDGRVWLCDTCETNYPGQSGTVITWAESGTCDGCGKRIKAQREGD